MEWGSARLARVSDLDLRPTLAKKTARLERLPATGNFNIRRPTGSGRVELLPWESANPLGQGV